MISSRSVIALFKDVDSAADALDAVRAGGFERHEYEILTGTPYPEGAFGEDEPKHGLYRYPLIGAACGFIIGLIITMLIVVGIIRKKYKNKTTVLEAYTRMQYKHNQTNNDILFLIRKIYNMTH